MLIRFTYFIEFSTMYFQQYLKRLHRRSRKFQKCLTDIPARSVRSNSDKALTDHFIKIKISSPRKGNFRNVLSFFPVCRRRVGEAPTSCCLVERFFLCFLALQEAGYCQAIRKLKKMSLTFIESLSICQSQTVVLEDSYKFLDVEERFLDSLSFPIARSLPYR